jgi:predicted transcriptional regulator
VISAIIGGILAAVSIITAFFTRLRTRSLIDNANRSRIIEVITEEPGIHFRELSRRLGLKQGVLSYHLNVLEKHEMIKSVQDSNNRRFYLIGVKVEKKIFLTEIQQSIIGIIYDSPGISQSAISRQLGRSKALINYHLRILKDASLVYVEKDKGITSYYPGYGGKNSAGTS